VKGGTNKIKMAMITRKMQRRLNPLALWLVTVGAVNWGLSVLGYNVVEMLASAINMPLVATVVYSAVGIAGVYAVYLLLAKQLK
jgi:uncharacterized membrane protein YuzA (DUF378 family)